MNVDKLGRKMKTKDDYIHVQEKSQNGPFFNEHFIKLKE